MFDTLLTIGSFQLRTLSIFQVLAFFSAAFVFWRRGRQEHYSEAQIMDAFLLTFLVGGIAGRIGFVALNFPQFEWRVLDWLNLVQFPGMQMLIGLIGACGYLFLYARKNKWDSFEVLDFFAQALSIALFWLNIGYFFAGVRFGTATNMPWGIIFPGVFEKRHPLQLYFAFFHLVMYKLLWWFEYNYRTFEWYRAGKKTAQTGFVFIAYVLFYMIFSLLMSLLGHTQILLGEIVIDSYLYVLMILLMLRLLLARARRKFFSFKEKRFLAVDK